VKRKKIWTTHVRGNHLRPLFKKGTENMRSKRYTGRSRRKNSVDLPIRRKEGKTVTSLTRLGEEG